jgi:hypothetical protein
MAKRKPRKSTLDLGQVDVDEMTELGVNVRAGTVGDVLVLLVDLAARHGASGSGKTTRIGSTLGNKGLQTHPGVKVGLNVYEQRAKEATE